MIRCWICVCVCVFVLPVTPYGETERWENNVHGQVKSNAYLG